MAKVSKNTVLFASNKYVFFWVAGICFMAATWVFLDAFFITGAMFSKGGFFSLILKELFLIVGGNYCWKRYLIIQSGLRGEERTLALTRVLPDTYKILVNVPLEFEGRKGELDQLVVGPNGVFAIEVKNHRGLISGGMKEEIWTQTRTTQKHEYSKNFKNPMDQLTRNIGIAKSILKANNVDVWMEPIVYFSNEDVELSVENERVVSDPDKLIEIIVNNKPHRTLNADTISKIVSTFGGD